MEQKRLQRSAKAEKDNGLQHMNGMRKYYKAAE